ncbi:MAG: transposase [Desulfovibrionaceae bacterium]|nr:transposase [Desulfovibrionaceae bacterium]MBF0514700.1 transposase [Desulfovibrionaceae bacterium]
MPVHYLRVDEKAFRKGRDYVTIAYDLMASSVEYVVAEDCKTESLEGYHLLFIPEQLEQAKVVAIIWKPYFQTTLEHVPAVENTIVHDKSTS